MLLEGTDYDDVRWNHSDKAGGNRLLTTMLVGTVPMKLEGKLE